jgi:hypothetical protein
MRQKRIGSRPVGYGYATETEYVTVEVKDCVCGNIVLEEYRAKQIDYKMAQYILKQGEAIMVTQRESGLP